MKFLLASSRETYKDHIPLFGKPKAIFKKLWKLEFQREGLKQTNILKENLGTYFFLLNKGKGGLKEIACWRVLETQRT